MKNDNMEQITTKTTFKNWMDIINDTITTVSDNSSSITNLNDDVNNVNIKLNSELKKYIIKTGSRGELAGNETSSILSGSQTITINSPDTIVMNTSGSVTLTFTSSSETITAVKVISLTATGTTTLTIYGAVWANAGEAPTWGTAGKHLVLVAYFIGGRVVLNVFDNDEG